MVNASSYTVELWMHLGDVLGGLQSSQELEVAFIDVISMLNGNMQGHPTTIFGKYLFGRRFEIENFRNICCKISCLPASPRIFEHLKYGIIARF